MGVLAISPGIAIGPVRVFKPVKLLPQTRSIKADQVPAECDRLQTALKQAIEELGDLYQQVARMVGPAEGAIFEAQQLMLQDPDLLADTQAAIVEKHLSATAALQQTSEKHAKELEALDSPELAARAADLRDAASRVTRLIINPSATVSANDLLSAEEPVILVAYDLTPSDTAGLSAQSVLGICTVVGGPTTHAAILARALEIPAIAGIDAKLLDTLQEDQSIAIDGAKGLLYLQPDEQLHPELYTANQQYQQSRAARQNEYKQWETQTATTADGELVQVYANVGDLDSVEKAAQHGAEGIGLLRTEFLLSDRPIFPNEQEQTELYIKLFASFAKNAHFGKTIVARTLDVGADKPLPALEAIVGHQQEANPALGVRGIRLQLLHEELLRQQIRALMRAAVVTDVELHIMFPMITTLEEVRRAKAVYEKVCQELEAELVLPKIQLGIMVETPAAGLMADVLVREIDFISIGANDLYQYVMAADRTNSRVMGLFQQLEPAVWRLIAKITEAAAKQQKPVAVCGELAADIKIGPLLVGLGVHELSMSGPAIGRVKAALHSQPLSYWQTQAQRLLEAETAQEIQELLEQV